MIPIIGNVFVLCATLALFFGTTHLQRRRR